MIELSKERPRALTDAECAVILGGAVGALLTVSTSDAVAAALQWVLEHRATWPQSVLDQVITVRAPGSGVPS
ncbi:MAG: hypothetical protein WAU56_07545 [Steroidobacteraceae bacterium]